MWSGLCTSVSFSRVGVGPIHQPLSIHMHIHTYTYKPSADRLAENHEANLRRATAFLDEGRSVIVDNTNVQVCMGGWVGVGASSFLGGRYIYVVASMVVVVCGGAPQPQMHTYIYIHPHHQNERKPPGLAAPGLRSPRRQARGASALRPGDGAWAKKRPSVGILLDT